MSAPLFSIDFACNDRQGLFEGHVRQIEIAGRVLLEAVSLDRPPRLRLLAEPDPNRGFVLSGKFWPGKGGASWVGNVEWERIYVTAETAADLLLWLREKHPSRWSCQGGDADLVDWWDGTVSLSRDEVIAALGRQA